MKKIIATILIVIATFTSYAQIDDLRQDLDFLFGQLDKTKVTSGYLAPYGLDAVKKADYNGILTDSNIVNSMDLFRFIYADIFSAKFNPIAPSLPTIENINQIFSQTNSNSLAIFFAEYEELNEAAIQNGYLRYEGGKLYDVNGVESRIIQPGAYISKNIFTANPLSQHYKNTVTFKYDPSLFFTNANVTVQTLSINFGNGYVIVPPNNEVGNTYTDSSGYHRIAIKAVLSNGNVVETYTAVNVEVSNTPAYRYSFANISNPDIVIPSSLSQSGCKVYIRRSVNTTNTFPSNSTLLKPFIVVEGLDTHDGAPNVDKTNYDINNLLREWRDLNFNGSPVDFNFDEVGQYDLVFIDWNNGVDDIRRNAATLELVINAVNARKFGSQQNVIMGISMGGLVSRYCLADMTKRSVPTQTRLLITHDSPHQGAYVPLALQHLVTGLQNKSILGIRIGSIMKVLDQGVAVLNSPAAQQQLIMTSANENGGVGFNSFLENIYRPMISFTPSDPQPQYRFVATSQGSQCGLGTIPVGGNLAVGEAQGSAGGVYTILTAGIISRLRLKVSINAKGLSGSHLNNEILYFRFRREVSYLFGLVPSNKTLLEIHRTEPSVSNPIPWESVPGGTIGFPVNTTLAFADNWNFLSMGFLGYDFRFTTASQFSFLPTVSALDVVNPTTVNRDNIFGLNATFTGANQFRPERIIAQEQLGNNNFNIPHTDFSSRNSRWIFNEMQSIPQTPTCQDECPNNIGINGNLRLCGGTQQYTINGLPANSSVAWSYTPNNGGLNITTNGNTANLSKNSVGQYTLLANVTKPCNSYTTSINIDAADARPIMGEYTYPYYPNNPPKPFQSYTQIGFMGPGSKVKLRMTNYNCSFLSFFSSNGIPVNWVANGSEVVITYYSANQTIQGQMNYSNDCGVNGTYSFFIEVTSNTFRSANDDAIISINPNPATNFVDVDMDETSTKNKEATLGGTNMDLVDLNSNMVIKNWKFTGTNSRHYQLNIVGIKKGIYSLRIQRDGNSYVKKLVIY